MQKKKHAKNVNKIKIYRKKKDEESIHQRHYLWLVLGQARNAKETIWVDDET